MGSTAMIIIGIDPGITGAIAYLDTEDPDSVDVFDMPVDANPYSQKVKKRVSVSGLNQILNHINRNKPTGSLVTVYLEHQLYRPIFQPGGKQIQAGGSSTFSLGDTYGSIRACVESIFSHWSMEEVRPVDWKGKRGLGLGKDKKLSLAMARELYPEVGDKLRRQMDHNRAEAVLIMEYGRLKEEGKL